MEIEIKALHGVTGEEFARRVLGSRDFKVELVRKRTEEDGWGWEVNLPIDSSRIEQEFFVLIGTALRIDDENKPVRVEISCADVKSKITLQNATFQKRGQRKLEKLFLRGQEDWQSLHDSTHTVWINIIKPTLIEEFPFELLNATWRQKKYDELFGHYPDEQYVEMMREEIEKIVTAALAEYCDLSAKAIVAETTKLKRAAEGLMKFRETLGTQDVSCEEIPEIYLLDAFLDDYFDELEGRLRPPSPDQSMQQV